MPTRNLTADEAAEFDGRKKLRAAKNVWEAKEQAVDDAKAAALAARRDYETARNDMLRQFGSA